MPPLEPEQMQLQFDFEDRPDALLTCDEIYGKADEELLRRLGEDRRLEKKSIGVHGKALGEYFSMWANTSPEGGVIVVGIRNDATIEGCSRAGQDRVNQIEKAGATYCPDAQVAVKQVQVHRDHDGKLDFVLVFRVKYHSSKVVRTVDGRAFIRRGDSKMELGSPDEIRQLQTDKGEIRFETEPCGLTYPQDFHQESIREFVESVRERKGWSSSHEAPDILELMHLGTRRANAFIANTACALLFARDPRAVLPGCRIRFLRFEGEQERVGGEWNAVKDEFVDGTIPEQIQRVAVILKSQLRSFSRLGAGGKFFTSPEYPDFTWYEAIVNACAHRAYGNGMSNMPIFVKMFDDKLIVESPGAFPPFVNPKNIYDVHAPRNPYLMDAMYYLKFVKCAHEGTRRIREEMRRLELPEPEFKQDETGFAIVRVTLRNNIKQRKVWVDSDVAEILGTQLAHTLTEDQKRCINFVAEHGEISVSDAQRLTGKTWQTARRALSTLVDRGILLHEHRKDLERDPKARFKLRGSSKD